MSDAETRVAAPSDDRHWSEFVASLEESEADDGTADETQVIDLRATLARLEAVERRHRELLEGLPLVAFVCGWESGRRMRYVSPQIEALLGFDQDEWLSDDGLWERRLHPEDRARVLEATGRAHSAGRPLRMEYRLLRNDGRAVWVREETDPPRSSKRNSGLCHGVLIDVSERHATERALERERARAEGYRARLEAGGDGAAATDATAGPTTAPSDPLTGLVTRPGLEERLHTAVEKARDAGEEVVLLCVDLDSFKLVNDSLGLEAGDELLRLAAARLCRLVGENDALARPGADEFLLMLGGLDPASAADAAEEAARDVSQVLADTFEVAGSELAMTAAVGASVYPRDAREPEALLKHADAAMHSARELGPGEFAMYGGGTIEARVQLADTARLRRAIGAGELVLHYQPIFELPSGRVSQLEALVRWERPGREMAPPRSFIPLAEESGLIDRLGRWVLDALLEQAGQWLGEGRDVSFSFNVSPRQLRRADFARTVARAIEDHSLDPSRFWVEITESSAMRESHAVEPLLRELRAAGLRLAVDDFGLGYSSLDRLRDLPFQMLKIDRSFLARTPEDDGCAGIVRAVLELAEALDMVAVAEGVETEEQRRFLEERRCPLAQGFLLARPLPAEEVALLLPAASAVGDPSASGGARATGR